MPDPTDEMEDVRRELEEAEGKAPPKAKVVPGTPFIERPAEMDLNKGSLCWLDGSRICGPDCMAFNADEGLDKSGVVIDTPNKCLPLVYMGQQGSAALSTIALHKRMKKQQEDAARGAPPPIPAVGGKSG